MASPVAPKVVAAKSVTPTARAGESAKLKQPLGMGKSPQARLSNPGSGLKSTAGRSLPGQSPSSKLVGGQSATGRMSAVAQPASSNKHVTSPSGSGRLSVVGQSAAGKSTTVHSSPGGKVSLGQASPRKSIFGKSVGQSGSMKLGSTQSPSKSFFGKTSMGKSPGSGQFDLPLALRKKRRPNAGMKRDSPIFMDKILSVAKSPKDGKTPPKRKLSQSSPNGSKMGLKHKADYVPPSSKKRKIVRSNRDQDSRNDFYCWVCHKEGSVICCELCPRVYHPKCAKVEGDPVGDWFCPECERATNAECIDSQSPAMSSLTQDQLAKLLMYALKRMRHSGAEPFLKPVNLQQNPGYEEFVFNPMDLSTLEKNIKKRMYGSTEAFHLDAKWILHNCIVFNGSHHKLTNSARMIIKICEYEMKEIEICPDCYLSASIKRDKWFCEVCREPHKLVWARLQGFPFWPSKVIREKDGLLDVRFFGQHDRAWVPITSCFMYSPEIPNPSKKKTSGLSTSVMEMELHIQNLKKTFGTDCFQYAPHRTPYGKFECLTLDPKDREKWSASREATLINGVNNKSSPKPDPVHSTIKIKMEPVDNLVVDREAEIDKPSEGSQGKTAKDPVPAKDTGEERSGTSLCSSQETENEKSSVSSQGLEKEEQSEFGSPSTNAPVNLDTSSVKNEVTNVRRQVFSITRKRTAGVEETGRATTKILDTLDTGSGGSSKSDSGNAESDHSALSSPSKAPAGVFEVSDESLDVDPEVEAQSPSVQLLGKAHVPMSEFNRSLAIKLNKVSPKSLGKMGRQSSQEAGEEADRMDNVTDQDNPSGDLIEKDTTTNQDSEKSKQSTTKCKESDEPPTQVQRPPPSIISASISVKPPKSNLNIEPSEGSTPDEDIASTSTSLPRKDKFHIKLGKTIETMKASLGIERLHSVDKETSDSESSAADSDSDSSEADHSEESEMEVDEDQGTGIIKKRAESSSRDGSKNMTSSSDNVAKSLASTQDNAPDVENASNLERINRPSSKPDQLSKQKNQTQTTEEDVTSRSEPKDNAGPSMSKKSRMDSDIDLVMSCHSEMSDSDDGELVIDESQIVDQTGSKPQKRILVSESDTAKTKNSSCEEPKQSTEAVSVDIHVDPVPMETDDVILVSDPFERQECDQADQSATEPVDVSPPVASPHAEEKTLNVETRSSEEMRLDKKTGCNKETRLNEETGLIEETRLDEEVRPGEESSKTAEHHSIPPVNPSSDNSASLNNSSAAVNSNLTSSKDNSQKGNSQIAIGNTSSATAPTKPIRPCPDPVQSAKTPLSSFPKILETLQASKKPVLVPDLPPATSAGEDVKSPPATLTIKDAPRTSGSSDAAEEAKTTAQDKASSKKTMYKKYMEKISTTLEGVFDEFSADLSEGLLLKTAKADIEELKSQVRQLTWERDQERMEFKQIMDLAVAEMKECMKAESKVALNNLRNQLEVEKQEEVRKTKTKQWCANCGKDAVFFCCWNTSYCDYPCQQTHWSVHRNSCQQRSLGNAVVQVQQVPNKAQQPSQPVPMQLHSGNQPNIQQQINQSASHQPLRQAPINQSANQPIHQTQINQSTGQQQQPPLHQTLQQQVQQVMPPQLPPANSQPMQTLIQYVQAPRMSAPLPVRQLLTHHPYTMPQGRIVGSGGMRMVRP